MCLKTNLFLEGQPNKEPRQWSVTLLLHIHIDIYLHWTPAQFETGVSASNLQLCICIWY